MGEVAQGQIGGAGLFGDQIHHQHLALLLLLAQLRALLLQRLQLPLPVRPLRRPLIDRGLTLIDRLTDLSPGAGPLFHRHFAVQRRPLRRLPEQRLQLLDLFLVEAVSGGGFLDASLQRGDLFIQCLAALGDILGVTFPAALDALEHGPVDFDPEAIQIQFRQTSNGQLMLPGRQRLTQRTGQFGLGGKQQHLGYRSGDGKDRGERRGRAQTRDQRGQQQAFHHGVLV